MFFIISALITNENDEPKPISTTPNMASVSPTSTPSTLVEAPNPGDSNRFCSPSSLINQNLNRLHEHNNNKMNDLPDSEANSVEIANIVADNEKTLDSRSNLNHHQKRIMSSSDNCPPLLPDDIAFRPDSTCSDHPSLATGSLVGMDFDSVSSQIADSESGFDSAIASAAMESFSGDLNISEHSFNGPFFANARTYSGRSRPLPVIVDVSSPTTTDQALAESVSSFQTDDPGIKNSSNSMLMTDSFSFGDEISMNDSTTQTKEQTENLHDASNVSKQKPNDLLLLANRISNNDDDQQPHYPLAFKSESISSQQIPSNFYKRNK